MKKNQIIVTEDGNGLVTKAFAKQARIFGTPEYKIWREFLKDLQDAQMVINTIKKDTKKDTYRKNMTYDNMRSYITTETNSKEILKEFENLFIKSKVQTCPYDYVTNWFIAKFPNYKKHSVFEDKQEENKNSNDELKIEG